MLGFGCIVDERRGDDRSCLDGLSGVFALGSDAIFHLVLNLFREMRREGERFDGKNTFNENVISRKNDMTHNLKT